MFKNLLANLNQHQQKALYDLAEQESYYERIQHFHKHLNEQRKIPLYGDKEYVVLNRGVRPKIKSESNLLAEAIRLILGGSDGYGVSVNTNLTCLLRFRNSLYLVP